MVEKTKGYPPGPLMSYTGAVLAFNGRAGTGPAMPLPDTIPARALATPPRFTEVSAAVLGHWIAHLTRSEIQDPLLDLFKTSQEIC